MQICVHPPYTVSDNLFIEIFARGAWQCRRNEGDLLKTKVIRKESTMKTTLLVDLHISVSLT